MSLSLIDIQEIDIVAAKNKNRDVAMKSTSAGVFRLLSESVIKQGGIVCGATFDDKFEVRHCFADDMSGIEKLQKSKYVKSDLGHTFKWTRQYLENRRNVLYSGAPCQIAWLKKYLGKEYDCLLTVDVICHGVPLPWVWRTYLKGLKEKYGAEIESVEFRKKDGIAENKTGHNLYVKIGETEICGRDAYMEGFLSGLFLMPSCYQCKYKNFKSGSDVQLGDFWGIHNVYPAFCKSKNERFTSDGISEVILLTDKGKLAFENIQSNFIWFYVNKSRFFHSKDFGNYHNLTESTPKHKKTNEFIQAAKNNACITPEFIYSHLDIAANKYAFGAIGSLAMSQVFQNNEFAEPFSLRWHFTASNIISMMSSHITESNVKYVTGLSFLNQIIADDVGKELRRNFDRYADAVDFLAIDLLDERFVPCRVTDSETAYVTGNKLFCLNDLKIIPLDNDDWKLWKERCQDFVSMITSRFEPSRIFILETYLARKYWIDNDTVLFSNKLLIKELNSELRLKYKFLKDSIQGVNYIHHDFGCAFARVLRYDSTKTVHPAFHPASLYRFYAKLIKYRLEEQFEPQQLRESNINRVKPDSPFEEICSRLI